MDGNIWKRLEINGNGWKWQEWMKMAEHGCSGSNCSNLLEMAGNDWDQLKWLEMTENSNKKNGLTCGERAENDWKWLERALYGLN